MANITLFEIYKEYCKINNLNKNKIENLKVFLTKYLFNEII